MKTAIDMKEQRHMVAHPELIVTDRERLAGCVFTVEERAALLWLRHWYQMGGSDHVGLVRHCEFLKMSTEETGTWSHDTITDCLPSAPGNSGAVATALSGTGRITPRTV